MLYRKKKSILEKTKQKTFIKEMKFITIYIDRELVCVGERIKSYYKPKNQELKGNKGKGIPKL